MSAERASSRGFDEMLAPIREFDELLAHHPEAAYGMFAARGSTQLELDIPRAGSRAFFAIAWEQRARCRRELATADEGFIDAVRHCHAAGASVTQLAVLAGVSRPTIYAWLDQEEDDSTP